MSKMNNSAIDQTIERSKLHALHTGYLYKRGDGPINYEWNKRFFVLDFDNKKLSYFMKDTDK